MLVLTRKLGESINIGAEMKVTVIAVKGRQVRLGIEAPDAVRIVRGELGHANPPTEKATARFRIP